MKSQNIKRRAGKIRSIKGITARLMMLTGLIINAAWLAAFMLRGTGGELRKGDILFLLLLNTFALPVIALLSYRYLSRLRRRRDRENKELEDFIYKASHDLRGPLSSIMGLIEISRTDVSDEKAAQYLSMIETASRKLDQTLLGLMQSLKIKDAKVFNDKIDFGELIAEIKDRLQYTPGFEQMDIQVKTSPIIFVSSKLILCSVLQNFMDNAIKYRDTRKKSFLNITIKQSGDQVEIIFEDNGIGIPADMQEKIFDMYFRATENSSGSGLGLYLVKAGIEKLDGTIELKSEAGKGSTFIIRLPLLRYE